MSAAKHTPGPWTVHAREHCGARIDGPNGRGVAHATQRDPHPAYGQGITQAEAEANARLIAAAPELLEALQRLLPAYREAVKLYDSNHDDAFTVQARTAIAKATGSVQ